MSYDGRIVVLMKVIHMRELFIAAVIITGLIRWWLLARHVAYVRAHRAQVPESLANRLSMAQHHKAADYTVARAQVSMVDIALDAVLSMWWLGGGLGMLGRWWDTWQLTPLLTGTALLLSWVALGSLVSLPLSLYRTFVVEARFGFNKSTLATVVRDLLIAAALSIVIGTPLIYALLWMMQALGAMWWLYAWVAFCLFQLVAVWAYPAVIAPLFNRFTPLQDAALVARIEALLLQVGFANAGLFVMDASRRSGHGNAYFTGIGNKKRIVFYDTLLAQLTPAQVAAVLAHELGHFKLNHIPKMVAGAFVMALAGFALLAWLVATPAVLESVGVTTAATASAIGIFLLVMPRITFWLDPLQHWWSRRHEYEADAFAAAHTNANDMVDALVVLFSENASTVTPDPLYVAWYYTHPPTVMRIAKLTQPVV